MESLHDFLSSLNLNFEPAWNQGWQKVPNEKYFTYVADEMPLESGRILKILTVNDWRFSDNAKVWTNKEDFGDIDHRKLTAAQKKAKLKQDKEKLELQLQAKTKAKELWEKSLHINGYRPEYFKNKGLEGTYGCRLHHECRDTILIPLVDSTGEIWNVQSIFLSGEKQFLENSRVTELFHVIPGNEEVSYLCEGLATGATLHDATGARIFVAFNAVNMKRVAPVLRALHPASRFVVAADNDRHHPENPGMAAAMEAAKVFGQGLIAPSFGDEAASREVSDFNDLGRLKGLEEVRLQSSFIRFPFDNRPTSLPMDNNITQSSPNGTHHKKDLFDEASLEPLPLVLTKQGKAILPAQQRVADHFLNHLNHTLAQQDSSLYIYTGTHWKPLDLDDEKTIKRNLQFIVSGEGGSSYINACFELLLNSVPIIPREFCLGSPNPIVMNLLNGSVHMIRESGQNGFEYRLEFKPHNKLDYNTTVLPFEYSDDLKTPEKTLKNKAFLEYLEKIFKGDADKEQKILALQEMYGACLMGAFPHLFFCVGLPKTGKSTIIKMAINLVNQVNRSGVDPTDFHGFHLHAMANKLVNCVTDVVTHKPINDSIAKQVVERLRFRIPRKFMQDLFAYLPPVHIFGGNGIPPTLEGSYKAHDRRWTFLKFNNVIPTDTREEKDIDIRLFQESPQGIFNWAYEGLERLICKQHGIYTQPESGKQVMKEWQTDVFEEFVQALKDGEIEVEGFGKVSPCQNGKIPRQKLADIFYLWLKKSASFLRIGRNQFYARMRECGVLEHKGEYQRYFVGYSTDEVAPSHEV